MYCVNCGEKCIEAAISCPSCGTEVRKEPAAQQASAAPNGFSELRQPSSPIQPVSHSYGLSDQSKKLILVGLGAVVVIYLIFKFAGGSGSQATPEKTVKNFMSAVEKENAKEMVSYLSISIEDSPEGENIDSFIEMLEGEFDNGGMDLRDYEITDVNMNGNDATVKYEVEYMEKGEKQTEEDSFELMKVKGKWYIDEDLGF